MAIVVEPFSMTVVRRKKNGRVDPLKYGRIKTGPLFVINID